MVSILGVYSLSFLDISLLTDDSLIITNVLFLGDIFFPLDIEASGAAPPFFLFTQQQLLTTEYTQLGLGRPRVALVVASLLFHCSIFRDGDNQC